MGSMFNRPDLEQWASNNLNNPAGGNVSFNENPYFGAYKRAPAPQNMGGFMQQAYNLSGVPTMPQTFTSGPYGAPLPSGDGGQPPVIAPPPNPNAHTDQYNDFLTNSFRDYAALARRAGYNGIKAYNESARVLPGILESFVRQNKLPESFNVPSYDYLMGLHQPGIDLQTYALDDQGNALRHGSTWKDDYFLKHWDSDFSAPPPNSPPPNTPPPNTPPPPTGPLPTPPTGPTNAPGAGFQGAVPQGPKWDQLRAYLAGLANTPGAIPQGPKWGDLRNYLAQMNAPTPTAPAPTAPAAGFPAPGGTPPDFSGGLTEQQRQAILSNLRFGGIGF